MDYNFLRFTNKKIQYDKTMLSIVFIFLALVFAKEKEQIEILKKIKEKKHMLERVAKKV